MINFKPASFKVTAGGIVEHAALVSCTQRGDSLPRNDPKDQELLAIFNAHHGAFQRIQQMATEDSRRGLYLDSSIFYVPDPSQPNHFEKSRQQEYTNLISEIRPSQRVVIVGLGIVTIFEVTSVRFIFAGGGTAIGPDWVKGIEFVPGDFRRDGVLLTNLDGASALPANVYLRQIETNWFIFYQRDD